MKSAADGSALSLIGPLLRSALFLLLQLLVTVPYALLAVLSFPLPAQRRYHLIMGWCRVNVRMIQRILGIRWRIEGWENLPQGPAVVLSKHQSALETILFPVLFPPQSFVLKRELYWLPFFGWGLAMLPMIAIDRSRGADAMTQVKLEGARRLSEGWWVSVYPEGTRMPVGGRRRYKLGGATLAAYAGAPIVPVALNTGELWPRRAFIKYPGEALIIVGPAIETAGRSPEVVNAEVEAWIETTMHTRFPHHYMRKQQTVSI
ncbi:1-acyl-sn-glycerol-3-phosphate acyltransferase [Niveibacterium sp. 24ML]|uniref:lysophospholipid acyltransferase family protein n=1 Tax=Niveibacterium sp. 24ML TaxID=2985512 RepID=UPI002270084C|nr:lysophospholipid acyltransferase family protein [Niveibacterium sp. 24ML]MCX9157722.1 1-acyl-sn-glycerol-3-phosphate acyltransferase [Niveibacterium sp. 24ML]